MSVAGFKTLQVMAHAAITSAGETSDQTACSIRARLVRHREHERYVAIPRGGAEASPLVVSPVRSLAPELRGPDRIEMLLASVVGDLLSGAGLEARDVSGAALCLALPSTDDVVTTWPLEALPSDLRKRTGIGFKTTRTSASGHTGFLEMLGEASSLLESGDVDAVVVAGVDSYVDDARLEALDRLERLHTPGAGDGFCPAEGAAAILLESPRRARQRGAEPLARITSLATGKEPHPILASDRQSTGVGLTEALRAACSAGPPAWWIDDLNGERYRAFEWGLVQARVDAFASARRVEHPAISTGDTGAAMGGVLVSTAISAMGRGWSPGEALVLTASEGPLRAVARITSP